jgi:hypothetical protein
MYYSFVTYDRSILMERRRILTVVKDAQSKRLRRTKQMALRLLEVVMYVISTLYILYRDLVSFSIATIVQSFSTGLVHMTFVARHARGTQLLVAQTLLRERSLLVQRARKVLKFCSFGEHVLSKPRLHSCLSSARMQ